MVCNMVLATCSTHLFSATSHLLCPRKWFFKVSGIFNFQIKKRNYCRKGDQIWNPSGIFCSENSRCSGAMPNHHPINTFMESSSWKVLPTTGKFLLTHIPMVLLSHFLSPEMEKRKTVQTFSHQDQRKFFPFHYFIFKELLLIGRLRDSRMKGSDR